MKTQSFSISLRNDWQPPAINLDLKKSLAFVFGSPDSFSDPSLAGKINGLLPGAAVVGCSSAGEIHGSEIMDHSLSIGLVEFDKATFRVVTVEIASAEESENLGKQLAQNLNASDLRAVFVISDGLSVNGTKLSEGFNAILHHKVPVTGGLAGDGSNFKSTWTFCNGEFRSNRIIAVGLYGESLIYAHGSRGGWDIFGPERVITKSKGNVLYEIDGRPALDLYEEYLGEKAKELPASALLFPLQIRANEKDEIRLVRTILGVDREARTMTFAGELPEGHLAQLMRANIDRLIDGASKAANIHSLRSIADQGPFLSIAISCIGRRLVMGERTEEEVEATLDALPPRTSQIGFYSYGELSPLLEGHSCELHNQTMTITVIGEKKIA